MSISLVICGLIFPNFCFGENTEAPSTLEEAKDFIMNIIKLLPEAMKNVWQNQVSPFWHKFAELASNWLESMISVVKSWLNWLSDWLSDIWYGTIKPWINNVLDWLRNLIYQKQPEFEEKIPETSKSLWQKIKDIFR